MSSFALWFDKDTTTDKDFFADIHFNLWNLHYRKAQPPCLDIGIKIYSPQKYSKIYMYVPFLIDNKDIEDLGKHLKESDILCTVFNEDYSREEATAKLEAWLKDARVNDEGVAEIRKIANYDETTTKMQENREIIENQINVRGIPTMIYDGRKHTGLWKAE